MTEYFSENRDNVTVIHEGHDGVTSIELPQPPSEVAENKANVTQKPPVAETSGSGSRDACEPGKAF